ncbi:MAG TPA: right-handed parallel beta-helix repeat-containing protein [Ignavibacteria bacterium]|nr:right-handed parallel beta-helix repeat-containing protein [Ignavibacteria bacterium]HMR41626.1 right-handed parallel beta-helix repeat-containing protein [Ignavibacteria bacterium]
MKRLKFILYFVIIITIPLKVFSDTYYISNSGNDKNNGLSPVYPWRNISKLNSVIPKLKPGDVVLFERNGFFAGQINLVTSGNKSAPIIFGAYGNGKNPVISGSVRIKNWSLHKGNIYKASTDTVVTNLFVNEDQMILARYPNSGFLKIKGTIKNSNEIFVDNNLKQKKDFWKGSVARIRTINWAYEYSVIKSFSNGTITLSNPTVYPIQKNWGYYLDNNLSMLDTINEWYFSKGNSSGTIYLYPPRGQNPENLFIEGSIISYGFYSSKNLSNIIIRDLHIQNQNVTGIWLIGKSSDIKIINCTFSGQNHCGINFLNSSGKILINNCRFFNINGKAIYLLNSSDNIISNNVIDKIGIIPGYGTTGDAFSQSAMLVIGNNCNISGNNISNVGHNGINCIGSGNIIEKNVLKNILLQLNDGGAIKSYGQKSTKSVWKHNFIFNVVGNMETADEQNNQNFSIGLYLDELSNNLTVSNNTIEGSRFSAIGTNSGFDNNFENNICYNNEVGMMFYQKSINCKNNIFKGNLIFGINADQKSIENIYYHGKNIPGIFGSNIYFNSKGYNVFRILDVSVITDYNFEKWKEYVNSDYDSKLIVPENKSYSKLYCNMSDDTVTIILGKKYNYQNVNLKNIYGSIILNPWTSDILISEAFSENLPEINIALNQLLFEKTNESEDPGNLWFNLIGKNLKNEVVITAPEGFMISLKNDENYSKSLTLQPRSNNLDNIIFVKFLPERKTGYYDFITFKSGELSGQFKVKGIPN